MAPLLVLLQGICNKYLSITFLDLYEIYISPSTTTRGCYCHDTKFSLEKCNHIYDSSHIMPDCWVLLTVLKWFWPILCTGRWSRAHVPCLARLVFLLGAADNPNISWPHVSCTNTTGRSTHLWFMALHNDWQPRQTHTTPFTWPNHSATKQTRRNGFFLQSSSHMSLHSSLRH